MTKFGAYHCDGEGQATALLHDFLRYRGKVMNLPARSLSEERERELRREPAKQVLLRAEFRHYAGLTGREKQPVSGRAFNPEMLQMRRLPHVIDNDEHGLILDE